MPSGPSRTLLIHAVGPRWAWSVMDRNGRTGVRGCCAPDQPDWPDDLPVRVLVDAAACVGLRVELPALSGPRFHQALKWAVEEQLASSAEDEHVVAGPRDADGRVCCVVINRARLGQLLAPFSGLALDAVVPDALCLPWQPGQVSALSMGGQVLARWGQWEFGSFDSDLLDELDGLLDQAAERVWFGPQPAPDETASAAQSGASDRLALLAGIALAEPVNLLTGPFASRSRQQAGIWWRRSAWAAAAVLGLAVLQVVVEWQSLRAQSRSLDRQITTLFTETFPAVGPPVRPLEQAERELIRLRFGETAGLLDLIHLIGPVVAAQDALHTQSLIYRDGRIEMSLRAPDVQTLNNLAGRLRALGLDVNVLSALIEDSRGVVGSIEVTAGAAS